MKNVLAILLITFIQLATAQGWYQIDASTQSNLTEVEFPSSKVGYIAGEAKTLLKTIDGGVTWNALDISSLSELDFNITDLAFLNENSGYMVLGNNRLYQTKDGGVSWERIGGNGAGVMCFLSEVHPIKQDHFFLGGSGCFQGEFIYEYINGEFFLRPDSLEMFGAEHTISDFAFNGNIGLATTVGAYILRSIDNGQSWDTIRTELESGKEYLTGVTFLSTDTVYASFKQTGRLWSGCLRSTDAGLSWIIDPDMSLFAYPSIMAMVKGSSNNLFAVGEASWGQGMVFDKQQSSWWNYSLLDQTVYDVATYGNNIAFAVGDSGYVVVNQDPITLGLEEEKENPLQVFPNPVQSKLQLVFPSAKSIQLEILNDEGKSIKQMILAPNQPSINVESFPSGQYWILYEWEGEIRKRAFVKI